MQLNLEIKLSSVIFIRFFNTNMMFKVMLVSSGAFLVGLSLFLSNVF